MSYININGKTIYIPAGVEKKEYIRNIELIEKVRDANNFRFRRDAYELIRSINGVTHSSMKQIQDGYCDYKSCDEWN